MFYHGELLVISLELEFGGLQGVDDLHLVSQGPLHLPLGSSQLLRQLSNLQTNRDLYCFDIH